MQAIRQQRKLLKDVHITISNAKLNFVGLYHKIKKTYLNKFVYKANLTYFGQKKFDKLVKPTINSRQ